METYHKISTLFKRSEDGKEVLFGTFANPYVEYLKDLEWMFTEKIDGTNIRIFWNGHKVTFGGRTNKADIPRALQQFLDNTYGTPEMEQVFEQNFGETEVMFFGEGYGAGIQKGGGNYCPAPSFILFDVKIGDWFLLREDVEDIAKKLSMEIVPVILRGTIHDGINYILTHPDSKIARVPHFMEGIVGTPAVPMLTRGGERIIVKIKWSDLKYFAGE